MNKSISIIVGSVLGTTEYVADAVKACLEAKGYKVKIFLTPKLEDISRETHWIICTSTHGAGELPDNISAFAEQLTSAKLTNTKATIIGLGDSSYDTFCYAAKIMEEKLLQTGCTISHPICMIDVLKNPIPEDKAIEWLSPLF